ncbi:MAG: FtsX-like permease family protein [Pirellulaceae bacterium]|nr:FtsX-like permease family protein [Pirellulaceae bacterium]
MLLPWEYGVRNLMRRPLRTLMTLFALTTVITLVFVVVGFLRGMERSLSISGDEQVAWVFSMLAEENIETSAIEASIPSLLTSSIGSTFNRFDVDYVSPELFLGTRVTLPNQKSGFGLVRGVTVTAPLVHRKVQLVSGSWPQKNEILVGRLAGTKLGSHDGLLKVGDVIEFEGASWTVSGHFQADGSLYEAELWCRLEDFQMATKRQDISLVALQVKTPSAMSEVQLFCKERIDLELTSISESEYYAELREFFQPLRTLAWVVVWLVAAAGVFTGLNMMYGAVAGRGREIATLQAIGYRRRAIVISVLQEGLLLAAAASLVAGVLALVLIDGWAVRFTMSAFRLRIDGEAIVVGCLIGLLVGVLGAVPPALRSLRVDVATGLKAI